jgi:hypothetical protein
MLGKLRSEREKAIEAIWLPLDSEALLLFSDFTGDLTERIQRYASQG